MPDHDDLAALHDLLPVLDGVWWTTPLTSMEFATDARLGVARVVMSRQWESLRATEALAEHDLAHLAVAYVRHACDEWLWMKYLATLELDQAQSLLGLMSANDIFRSVAATQKRFGEAAMLGIGFRQQNLDHSVAMVVATKGDLSDLGETLGWPRGGRPPSTAWVAERVGQTDYYDYIFSASSRFVHFSAGEAVRRVSFGQDQNIFVDEVRLQSDLMTFAIDTLLRLFALTFHACAGLLGVSSWPRQRVVEIEEAIGRYSRLKAVPFITAADFDDYLGGRRGGSR